MSKRFTDSDKWTKNKWFRELPNEYKLFWLYLLDNCDSVGIWEEDINLFNLIMNCKIEAPQALELFGDRIKILENGKKWWLVYFCLFQYAILDETNTKNKPMQYYIKTLKFNDLWADYLLTLETPSRAYLDPIDSPKEKDKEKEKEKDKEKEVVREAPQESAESLVFAVWQAENIVKHSMLTDKAKRTLNGLLKAKNSVEDICLSIKNYAHILHSQEYYFKYKWTLQDFLARGFEKFKSLEIAQNNYRRSGFDSNKADPKSNRIMPQANKYNKYHKGDSNG